MRTLVPARNVPCPACQAPAGEHCTAPTSTGRREVSWVHSAREYALTEPVHKAAEALTESLIEQDVELRCGACGDWESDATTPASVRRILEHCAFAHPGRADVLIVRTSALMSSNELGLLLRLAPLTDAEQAWRDQQAEDLR